MLHSNIRQNPDLLPDKCLYFLSESIRLNFVLQTTLLDLRHLLKLR